jgi:DNA-binding PadR family transcriptional regulator
MDTAISSDPSRSSHSADLSQNLWALTVLCLLRERPMHPYEMQRLIRQRRNDNFLDLKRGSLYHAIGRLQRAGLIEAVETRREGKRPERTVYKLTEAGEREVLGWLRDLLAKPGPVSTPFFAALSFLAHLRPEDVLAQLGTRAECLEAEIAATDAVLREIVPRLGRLVLVEVEYTQAMRRAELEWVRALSEDVRTGRLPWKAPCFCPPPSRP